MPSFSHVDRGRSWTALVLLLALGCSSSATTGTKGAAASADAAGTSGDVAATTAPKLVADAQDKGPAVTFQGVWQESAKRMQVQVWVRDFPHLLGLAGHLRYDPEALRLESLKADGVPVGATADPLFEAHAVARDTPPGRVLAGAARLNSKPSPWLVPEDVAVSSELWLTLIFDIRKPGSHKLYFDPDTVMARSADGKPIAVQWGSAHIAWGGDK